MMKCKRMKRLFALLLSIVCLLAALPFTASAEIVDSGICGDNITWTIESIWNSIYGDWNTTLVISGTGPMYDYGDTSDNHTPWTTWHSGFFVTGDHIESVVISDGITRIGNNAFYGLRNLRDIHIPNSVEYIGECAFFEIRLSSISLPENLIKIENSAFMESYLTNIVIPSSVRSIEYQAFKNCYYLTSVELMNGVTSIGESAFADCTSLASIVIPNSVTSIGGGAFAGCTSLASITVDAGNLAYSNDSYGVLFNKDKTELIQYPLGNLRTAYTIPDGVTSIEDWAFEDFDGLTSVTIPSSVTNVGKGAFYNCGSLTDIYYSGSEAQWKKISIGSYNADLLNATIHYGEKMPARATTDDTLPTATRYVPYSESVPAERQNSTFTIPAGSLPNGLSMNASGVIEGIPTELGTYIFTVTETNADGSTVHTCTLPVYSQVYADVEKENIPGYGFVETPKDNGRVPDQYAASKEELEDKIMHCEGAYAYFVALYIDAKKLTRGVDYTAAPGSTKITILAETFGEFGGGTHTIAAEFKTENEQKVYTVQNYTVTGIASKELLVKVKGTNIEWTDSEPFINSDNRTMTPFRAVAEALGLTAEWNSATREAIFSNGSKTIYFPIGSKVARTSDGGTVQMDTSAVIVGGRTYAPIRFLAEYFGFVVDWVAAERLVTVD